jgi:hypothetical protein
MGEKTRHILALAREMASQHNDIGQDKAADILLNLIRLGNQVPEILIQAAAYLLQGLHSQDIHTQYQAISYLDQAITKISDDISLLENAIQSYELDLARFPDRIDNVIRLCLKILDLNPDHVEARYYVGKLS